MTTKNDGGPAFPCGEKYATQDLAGVLTNHSKAPFYSGMTLRDYFAAKAPPPPDWWMENYSSRAGDLYTVADCVAQWNYVYADAMLSRRSKP